MSRTMKLAAGLVLIACAAMATGAANNGIKEVVEKYFLGGLYIGPAATMASNTNKLTKSFGASATIDFASATTTCTDSTAITVTGAVANDACFVGAPAAISGDGTGLNSTFSCYVSATNAVKVRHCAAGTADDPASGVFYVRVFSGQ